MGKLQEFRSNIPGRNSNFTRGGRARGSLHTISNGRITNRHNVTFNKFDSRVDARMKLISQREARPRDARDILKQKFRENISRDSNPSRDSNDDHTYRRDRDSYSNARGSYRGSYRGSFRGGRPSFSTRSREREREEEAKSREKRPDSRNDPIVIVTGLGNTSRDRNSRLDERDHYVTSRGNNTLITLNNDKYSGSGRDEKRTNRSRSRNRSDNQHVVSKNAMNFEPIKIKITNSHYVPKIDDDSPHDSENNTQFFNQNRSNNSSTKNASAVNNKSDDSMDLDSSDYDTAATAPKYPLESNAAASFNNIYSRLLPSVNSFQLPPSLSKSSTLNSFNATLNAFRPPGLIINNFPTQPMYSQSYDTMWNKSSTNFYDQSEIIPSLAVGGLDNGAPSNNTMAKPQSHTPAAASKDGYKLLVSNLHPKVTEDDVLELFSDIGPIKRARFIDKGLAEVIYVRIEHAKEAIEKYDLKELDGRQMVIGFADKSHLASEVSKKHIEPEPIMNTIRTLPQPQIVSTINTSHFTAGSINPALLNNTETLTINASNSGNKYNNHNDSYYKGSNPINTLSDRFKSKSKEPRIQIPESKHHDKLQSINHIENSIIHQVLFNKRPLGGTPVTFTVKL